MDLKEEKAILWVLEQLDLLINDRASEEKKYELNLGKLPVSTSPPLGVIRRIMQTLEHWEVIYITFAYSELWEPCSPLEALVYEFRITSRFKDFLDDYRNKVENYENESTNTNTYKDTVKARIELEDEVLLKFITSDGTEEVLSKLRFDLPPQRLISTIIDSPNQIVMKEHIFLKTDSIRPLNEIIARSFVSKKIKEAFFPICRGTEVKMINNIEISAADKETVIKELNSKNR